MKAIIDIENLKRGRKGRELDVTSALKGEILLAGITKNDYKKGSRNLGHSWIPTQLINK